MKILFTIADGFHLRYLFDTGLIESLSKKNHNIILAIPDSLDIGDRKSKFDQLNLILERVPLIKNDFIKKIIINIRLIQSKDFVDVNSIKYEQLRRRNSFLLANFIFKPLYYFNVLDFFADILIKIGPISKVWSNIFRKHIPDLIFLSTPGQKLFDLEPLQISKNKKILSFSAIYSLDNLTAKGLLFTNTDYLSVWSSKMKGDAIRLHGYCQDTVFIDGAAITDSFYKFKRLSSSKNRSNFLESIGLEANEKFLTIATIPQYYWGTSHINLARDILEINSDIKIFIKPHPLDNSDYSKINSPRVVIDPFHGGFNNNSIHVDLASWKAPSNHIENLSNIMMYSECVINVASSIAIDASIFGTPGINIAFDYEPKNQILPAIDLYRYTHYKRILDTNGTYFVYDLDELKNTIELILSGNDTIGYERELMSEIVYGKCDGSSVKRIISSLESIHGA
jgi:hypothetical protein